MLHLALGLVHNKGNLANRQQIQNLLPLVVKNIEPILDPDTNQPMFDAQSGDPLVWHWYSLAGLSVAHEVKFYQVIPFGVNPPNNLYDLDSAKVYYGPNHADKTGEHPRFFNWLLKRGTDNGAGISLYLRFPALFGAVDLDLRLGQLVNDMEFLEPAWGKVATLRLLRVVGQLREDTNFDAAVTDLKARIIQRGLRHG